MVPDLSSVQYPQQHLLTLSFCICLYEQRILDRLLVFEISNISWLLSCVLALCLAVRKVVELPLYFY